MEWISVKKMLPEKNMKVLCFYHGKRIKVFWFSKEKGMFFEYENRDHYVERYAKTSVTHWMPLPEPPKGTNNDQK